MDASLQSPIAIIRNAIQGTAYEGRLYIVGGYVRDLVLGISASQHDIDIVLEGDALELANALFANGITDGPPVIYPRFGTAMVSVAGSQVELVSARTESYSMDSRKPSKVLFGTLLDDAKRRDFTINTLLQSLDTGDILDPLSVGFSDIGSGIIRTPREPRQTFADDPLRMLRAVRFASKLKFSIDPITLNGIRATAERLTVVSPERIRDEICKMLQSDDPAAAMDLLRHTSVLEVVAPELATMIGVTQNAYHALDVWDHTLLALKHLSSSSSLTLRLATLFHDCGKPGTKTVDTASSIHFFGHQDLSAKLCRNFMVRLRFSKDITTSVTTLVAAHMRIGEYSPCWSDGAVRRLVRYIGPQLPDLYALYNADVSALHPAHRDPARGVALMERIRLLESAMSTVAIVSPLSGADIIRLTGHPSSPFIGQIKRHVTELVIDGTLDQNDRDEAEKIALLYFKENRNI